MTLATPTATGPVIERYELLGRIARGGMGTVYVARQAGAAGFRRLVALKLMHDHLTENPEFVRMFRDEARLAALIHHPNVVPIIDTGAMDGREFVVMDYVEGCSLAQLMALSPGERPLRAITAVFVDFLAGLHAAHELRSEDGSLLHLVHRDVSPQNVLVGLDGVARITDFGIAKAEERLTQTRTGIKKGKPAYMSPEQLLEKDVDRRSDLFAAGAMLWTCLTGEPLFAGQNEGATVQKLLTAEVLPPSQVGLKPLPIFDEVCLRALQRDPDERYPDAASMVRDIRLAASNAGVLGTAEDLAAWIEEHAGAKVRERRQAIHSGASVPNLFVRDVMTSATTDEKVERDRRRPVGLILSIFLFAASVALAFVAAFEFTGEGPPPAAPANAPILEAERPEASDVGSEASAAATHRDGVSAGDDARYADSRDSDELDGQSERESAEQEDEARARSRERNQRLQALREQRLAARREEETRADDRSTDDDDATSAEPVREPPEAILPGYLTLDTTPWSQVAINGTPLGTTPLIRVEVPAGTHTLTLVNPELSVRTLYTVRIRSGETTIQRVGLN